MTRVTEIRNPKSVSTDPRCLGNATSDSNLMGTGLPLNLRASVLGRAPRCDLDP